MSIITVQDAQIVNHHSNFRNLMDHLSLHHGTVFVVLKSIDDIGDLSLASLHWNLFFGWNHRARRWKVFQLRLIKWQWRAHCSILWSGSMLVVKSCVGRTRRENHQFANFCHFRAFSSFASSCKSFFFCCETSFGFHARCDFSNFKSQISVNEAQKTLRLAFIEINSAAHASIRLILGLFTARRSETIIMCRRRPPREIKLHKNGNSCIEQKPAAAVQWTRNAA